MHLLLKTIFSNIKIREKLHTGDVNFLGFGEKLKSYQSIIGAQEHDGHAPEGVLVFVVSANGDYVCFDYRLDPATDNPPVGEAKLRSWRRKVHTRVKFLSQSGQPNL